MENFLNKVFESITNEILNGNLRVEDFMSGVGCKHCPLRVQCGEAADAGDNRTCELFIRTEAK